MPPIPEAMPCDRTSLQAQLADMTGLAYILLLILLLQDGNGQAGTNVPGTPLSSTPAKSNAAPPENTEETSGFSELIAGGEYIPLPQNELVRLQLLRQASLEPSAPAVRTARYSALLQGHSLVSGSVQFTLCNPNKTAAASGLLLGSTSLQHLQLRDPGGLVPLGSDRHHRLFMIKPGLTGNLSGTWNAEGLVSGDSTIFRLELPASIASTLQLKTPSEIDVTGIGCLVLGPQTTDSGLLWDLHASDPARIAFSCRTRTSLQASEPLTLNVYSANHTLNGDIMSSRWTFGLPQNIRGITELSARLSPTARVTAVRTDDSRSVQWESRNSENSQLLLIRLADVASAGSLTISATSVIPDAGKWDLPALAMQEWLGGQETRGPLLTPVGIVSVTLPAAVNIDDWTLSGMQERDVVPGPDQSRTHQLTQYSHDAAATVRTSTTAAVLSDTVATVLQPAGELAVVRCFVNVQCRDAAVIELKWPITAGWQIVAARYASNNHSLYFEQRTLSGTEASDGSDSSMLTVHLPEALEPDTSRVIELQIQQYEKADTTVLQPPLAAAADMERTAAWLLYSPATSTASRLPVRWTSGLQVLANESFLAAAPWFPADNLTENTLCFLGDNSLPQIPPETQPSQCQVIHQLQTDGDGVVVENLQVECAAPLLQTSLIIRLPAAFAEEIRWTVNGQSVNPAWRTVAAAEETWRDAVFSLQQPRKDSGFTLIGNIRRAVAGEFTAAVPFLPEAETTSAVILVPRPDLKILKVNGLQENTAPNTEQMVSWKLPVEPQLVLVQLSGPQTNNPVQSADAACYHLIRERSGQVEHRMLAIIDVQGKVAANSLLIDTANTQPRILVQGRRVAAARTSAGLEVPLPPAGDRCRVVLTWDAEFTALENIRSRLPLSRLKSINGTGIQLVHHLLVAPELEPKLPDSEFRVTDVSVPPHMEELAFSSTSDSELTTEPFARLNSGPHAETTQFQLHWEISRTRGWTRAWFVQPDTTRHTMVLDVTQIQRRRIVAAGMGIVFFGICLSSSSILLRNPPAATLPVIMLSLAGLFELAPVARAALHGAFWGSACGLLLILSIRGLLKYLRGFRRTAVMQTLAILYACSAHTLLAQESVVENTVPVAENDVLPAILQPPRSLTPAGLAFVRRDHLQQLRQIEQQMPQNSVALVRSIKTVVTASTPESVLLELQLTVSVPSSDQEGTLRLPIRGTQLVSCDVDGLPVFPDPEIPDQLAVRIPASRAIPEISISASNSTGSSVAADEVAAFSEHLVVCRLRPATLRQPSGLQFRIPLPPSPKATIDVVAAQGLFSLARLQTTQGFIQWIPDNGPVEFNGLAVDDGVDVRLLKTELDRSSAKLGRVEVMTVAENASGLQNLNCYCRFEQWNPLSSEIRYRIPDGFRLLSVAAAAGFQNPELLWSAENQLAVISLPGVVPADFILQLQLRSTRPLPLQQQSIPVQQLNQFADCTPATGGLLALRASSIFAPVAPETNLATPLSFTDVSPRWGPWLRRSDLIFRISENTTNLLLTAPDRVTSNEVRISQECSFTEQSMNWKCRMDVETSALAIFRHRITIPDKIIVQEVEVSAGEANRLASWHRRGNQVVILLREGTTGLHAVTLQGIREILPDDNDIRIASPTLENSQILESSLLLNDTSATGLVLADAGDAVSDPPLKPGDSLQPGSPLRLTIVGETRPVRLTRLNPVDPVGTVAAWGLSDRFQFAIRLSQWSVALGPLEMRFPENTRFVAEPVVLFNREKIALQRDGQRFFVGGTAVSSLFGQTEFTVVWSLPGQAQTSNNADATTSLPWPTISERINWSELLLAETTSTDQNPMSRMPDWALDAHRNSLPINGTRELQHARRMPTAPLLQQNSIQLPTPLVSNEKDAGSGNSLIAVSATVVAASPGQSPSAETEFLLFSRVAPFTCILEVPDTVAVMELPNEVLVSWEDPARRRLVLSSATNLTRFKLRWLARLPAEPLRTAALQLAVPFVRNSQLRQHIWIVSPLREMPSVSNDSSILTSEQQQTLLEQDLRIGQNLLSRSGPSKLTQNTVTTEQLSKSIQDSIAQFTQRESHDTGRRTIRLHRTRTDAISISFRRHLELAAIIPIGVGMFLMVLSVMSANGSATSTQSLTTVVSPNNLLQSAAIHQKNSEAMASFSDKAGPPETSGPDEIRN